MMGTYRSTTWVVLFALLAGVSSGFGITSRSLELFCTSGEKTICDAQATIARILSGRDDSGEAAQTICALQRALGESTDSETEGEDFSDPVLAIQASCRLLNPDQQTMIAVLPVASLNVILPALDDACASVPPEPRWSALLPSYRYRFLLTPHAPPFYV